jgi:hypothetical protein
MRTFMLSSQELANPTFLSLFEISFLFNRERRKTKRDERKMAMLSLLTSRKRGVGVSNQFQPRGQKHGFFQYFSDAFFTALTLGGGRLKLSFPHLDAPKTNKKITALLSLNKIGTAYTPCLPACGQNLNSER